MSGEKKERLTVDLEAEPKRKLRILTALHGEKHMQKMVIRLINEAYERSNIGSISAANPRPIVPNFADDNMKNFEGQPA